MIFTFWVHDDARDGEAEEAPQAVAAWRENQPGMGLYSDSDVLPILDGFGSTCVDLYRRIRIPACKSDLARLLLLWRLGGLYVDSHTGPGNAHRLVEVFAALAAHELVLFDKIWEHTHTNDIYIMNSVMCARQSSPVVKQLIDSALHNLQEHERKEHAAQGHVPYNIFVLTGAWDIRKNFFEMRNPQHVIKPKFADRVKLVGIERDQDPGFVLYKYYGYRREGRHWSERQASEPLFLPR